MSGKKDQSLEEAIKKSEKEARKNEEEYRRYLNEEEHFPFSLGPTPSAYHNSTRIGEVLSTGGSSTRPKDPRDKFEKQRPPGVPFIPAINKPPRPARGPRPTGPEKTEDGRIIVRDSSGPKLLYRALTSLRDYHKRWADKNANNIDFKEFLEAYNKPPDENVQEQKKRVYCYKGSISSFAMLDTKYREVRKKVRARKKIVP